MSKYLQIASTKYTENCIIISLDASLPMFRYLMTSENLKELKISKNAVYNLKRLSGETSIVLEKRTLF